MNITEFGDVGPKFSPFQLKKMSLKYLNFKNDSWSRRLLMKISGNDYDMKATYFIELVDVGPNFQPFLGKKR